MEQKEKSIEMIEQEMEATELYLSILFYLQQYEQDQQEMDLEKRYLNDFSVKKLLKANLELLGNFCKKGAIDLNKMPLSRDYWDGIKETYEEQLPDKTREQLSTIRHEFLNKITDLETSLLTRLFDLFAQNNSHYYDENFELIQPLLPYLDLPSLDFGCNLLRTSINKNRFEQARIIFEKLIQQFGETNFFEQKEVLEQAFNQLSDEEKENYRFLVSNVIFQDQQYEQELFVQKSLEQWWVANWSTELIPMKHLQNKEINKVIKNTIEQKEIYKNFIIELLTTLTKEYVNKDSQHQFLNYALKQQTLDYEVLEAYYQSIILTESPSLYSYTSIKEEGAIDFSKLYQYDFLEGRCNDLLQQAINLKDKGDTVFLLYRFVPSFQVNHQEDMFHYLLKNNDYESIVVLIKYRQLKANSNLLSEIKEHFRPIHANNEEQENETEKLYYALLNYIERVIANYQKEEQIHHRITTLPNQPESYSDQESSKDKQKSKINK